jgi:hypothetical protein
MLGAESARGDRDPDREPLFPELASGRNPADLQMDQIRDLLFGEFKTRMESRLAAMAVRLAALEAGLAAARSEEDQHRKATFDTLADGLGTLANQIRQLRP